MKRCISIIGPPCAGKTTQSKILSERMRVPYISLGNRVRDEIKNQSEFGMKFENLMAEGVTIFDDMAYDLLKESVKEIDDFFIMEGFPRSVEQLDQLNSHKEIEIIGIVELVIEDPTPLLKRMENRVTSSSKATGMKRKDDTKENITHRYHQYLEVTKPIKRSFVDRESCFEVDATMDEQMVTNRIMNSLQGLVPGCQ